MRDVTMLATGLGFPEGPVVCHDGTEFSPAGDVVHEVKRPDVYPTNLCFGGPDMRTAYITLSDTGRVGMMPWPEPGLKLHSGSWRAQRLRRVRCIR